MRKLRTSALAVFLASLAFVAVAPVASASAAPATPAKPASGPYPCQPTDVFLGIPPDYWFWLVQNCQSVNREVLHQNIVGGGTNNICLGPGQERADDAGFVTSEAWAHRTC